MLEHKSNPNLIGLTVVGFSIGMAEVVQKSKIGTPSGSKRSKVPSANKKSFGPGSLKIVLPIIIGIPINGFHFGIGKDIGEYVVASKSPTSKRRSRSTLEPVVIVVLVGSS